MKIPERRAPADEFIPDAYEARVLPRLSPLLRVFSRLGRDGSDGQACRMIMLFN